MSFLPRAVCCSAGSPVFARWWKWPDIGFRKPVDGQCHNGRFWKRVFCQGIQIPAKTLRYSLRKRNGPSDGHMINSVHLSPTNHSSFMNVCTFHGSWNMPLNFQNELLSCLPASLPSSHPLSLFLFSPVIMLARFLFQDFFFINPAFGLLYCSRIVSKSSSTIHFSVGKEAGTLFLTWILVRGLKQMQADWCDKTHSHVSKLPTKAEVYLKSPWLEENPIRNVLAHTQSAPPWAHVAVHQGPRPKAWHVCVAKYR